MQMNLNTTMKAYPKLSDSILKDYATVDALNKTTEDTQQAMMDMKQEIANTYVPEVEDRETSTVYARRGSDRSWVALKDSTIAENIEIYFGSNDQSQMDTIEEIRSLATIGGHSTIEKNSKEFNLNYMQRENGRLWICTTQPVKSITWENLGGIFWGDYSEQKDKVTDTANNMTYFCYYSNEILLGREPQEGPWKFKLIF